MLGFDCGGCTYALFGGLNHAKQCCNEKITYSLSVPFFFFPIPEKVVSEKIDSTLSKVGLYMRKHDLGGFSSLDMKWVIEKQQEEQEEEVEEEKAKVQEESERALLCRWV